MRSRFKWAASLLLSLSLVTTSVIPAFASGGGTASGGNNSGGNNGGAAGSANGYTSYHFGLGYVIYLTKFSQFMTMTTDKITPQDIQNGTIRLDRQYNSSNAAASNEIVMSGQLFAQFPENVKTGVALLLPQGTYREYANTYSLPEALASTGGNVIGVMAAESSPVNAMAINATSYLPSGQELASGFQAVFGDAGGKLSSLLAALQSNKSTAEGLIVEKRGGGSHGGSDGSGGYEVSTDATVSAEEANVALLSMSEVKEQFEHYMMWWEKVYESLGGNYKGKTMSEVRAKFNDCTTAAAQYMSSSGPGGTETIMSDPKFSDFIFMTKEVEEYPCVGIETLCLRRHDGESYTRAMTWFGALYGGTTVAGQNGVSYLKGHNSAGYPFRDNPGQKNIRSAGLVFTNGFFYKSDGSSMNELRPNAGADDPLAGYCFFGFYGALPTSMTTITTIPQTPPPDNPPPPADESADDLGTYYLMDYELNHVFDSMAEHYQDSTAHDHARLNTGICTTDPSDYSDCGHGKNDYNTTEYYDVKYWENDGNGKSVDMDNAGPTKLFLHNNEVKGNTWWTRNDIKNGQVLDSNSAGDYVIDYGFNLLRKHFDDARAYSKIIAQDVAKEYLENTLGMYEAIITNNPKKITTLRDSTAIVGEAAGIKDNLSWGAQYNKTSSTTKYYTQSASHIYYCGGNNCSGHTCNYNTSHDGGSIKAFSVHGGTPSKYSVRLISIAHKYQTTTIPTGYAQPKDVKPFDYRPTTDGNGRDDDEQYRGSNTIDPGTEVTYVPEVPMIADEVPGPELEHHPKKVTTVGEESRKSKLILMTLYRVTGASTPVKGVVYSDTAVGGDAGLSSQTNNRLLALTAGGDFTVKADTNMQVNLYGYALDLIEPGDTGYDAVTLGNDVKAGWGNSGSRTALMNKYQEWAAAMLNPRNYQADFEMTIGSKKYNSFSATVGSFSSKASQSTETGQYNIHVKHGKIQEDTGYQAFISQLASDYGCSIDEAKALFTNSDMASAIVKAIEHDESSLNKSKPAKYALAPGETGTFNEPDRAAEIGGLGNASHWYDEEVRVFVIRRFMTPAAKITNIIAQDKMDIGTSMESLGGDTRGEFNLNVWFRDSCYTRAVTEYWPSTNGSDNKSQAISDGGLIIAGVDVEGADFNITNATTATGKH